MNYKNMWVCDYVIAQDAIHYVPVNDGTEHTLIDCECHPVIYTPNRGPICKMHHAADGRPKLREDFGDLWQGNHLVFSSVGHTV